MKILALLWLLAGAALAQEFPVNSHLSIVVRPDSKAFVRLHGPAWPGKAPTLARLTLTQESFGKADILIPRLFELASLRPASRPGHWTQGLVSSREQKRSCSWVSEDSEGGCLVVTDIAKAVWQGENNLTLDPRRAPILATSWLTPRDLRALEKAAYKAMDAQRKLRTK